MRLDSDTLDFAVVAIKQNLDNVSKFCYPNSVWVKLVQIPHPFSFEEALLLCRISDCEWLAWIPDYGEAILHTKQFHD